MAFISITVKHFFNNGANELQKEKCNKYLLTSSSLFIRTDSKALRFKKASLRYFTCAVYIAFILKQIIDITTLFKQRTHFWPLLSMYEAQNRDSRGSNIYVFTIKIINIFPVRLLQNIKQSFLCYTVGPCQLSILNIVVYIYITPKLQFVPPPNRSPLVTKSLSSMSVSLFF